MSPKIFIAGGACSGKSTLAKAIADHTGYPAASFGGILREHARTSNLPLTTESLQNLGQGLISRLGYDGFLQWIIAHSPEVPWQRSLVLDGVRHRAMHESLKKAFPASVLVYCVCHRDTQIERMMNRDGVSREEALLILSHPLEQFISDMEPQSDLFFRPEDSLQDFLDQLDDFMTGDASPSRPEGFASIGAPSAPGRGPLPPALHAPRVPGGSAPVCPPTEAGPHGERAGHPLPDETRPLRER